MNIKPITNQSDLFEMLSLNGGNIVCISSLTPNEVAQAQASKRIWVDPDTSIGYVWEPNIRRFPMTVEEVEEFEKLYPLEEEFPDELKTPKFTKQIRQ